MKILILGGDGYLGWPTAMHLAARGHEVVTVDNYLKRTLAQLNGSGPLVQNPQMPERVERFEEMTGTSIRFVQADCTDYERMREILRNVGPDTIIHYAEIPSAPYSMMSHDKGLLTMANNLHSTLALAHAVMRECPEAHIVKLGTMGEYGTPNVAIKEGWLDYEDRGRQHRFLYPSEPSSLYHVTKVQDTHMLWLYCRTNGLRVTDIMQGPVYGLTTSETALHPDLATNFYYDDLFGTVINRFVVQAVSGVPLTVYGGGGQTRGFIHIRDVMNAVELLIGSPPESGDLRIVNQITSTHRIDELAEKTVAAAKAQGISAKIEPIDNPRKEMENHHFDVEARTLLELGLDPTPLDETTLGELLSAVYAHRKAVRKDHILPRYSWNR